MAFNAITRLGCLFSFALVIARISGRAVEIQAEQDAKRQGYGPERVIDRSNASNKKNVHLLAGESLSLYFCLPREDYVTIDNVAFSNDGWVDNITVSVDGKEIGVVRTHDESAWGFNWNVLYTSDKIGDRQNLVSGLHTITLKVEDGDEWGVELDSVCLSVENLAEDADLFCTETDKVNAGVKDGEPVGRSLPETGKEDIESRSITNNETPKISDNNSKPDDKTKGGKTEETGNTGIQAGCNRIC